MKRVILKKPEVKNPRALAAEFKRIASLHSSFFWSRYLLEAAEVIERLSSKAASNSD